MSATTDTPAITDTISVSAADLKQTLMAADEAVKSAATQIAELTEENARLRAKTASDASAVAEGVKAAVASLIKFHVIAPEDEKYAIEKLANHADALAVLSRAVDPAQRSPRPVGKPVKAASSGGNYPVGRITDLHEERERVNQKYFEDLGVGS